MKKNKKTKKEYVLDFFKKNPNKLFKLEDIDERIKKDYSENTGSTVIYTNRNVRALYAKGYEEKLNGYLDRPKKGYYILKKGKKPTIFKSPFPQKVKIEIKKRDKYKCQMCGVSETPDNILAIDHVIPEDKRGKGEKENGITLCTKCNNIKKNHDLTTFGKNFFKKHLKISKSSGDKETSKFIEEILKVFDNFDKS